MSNSFKVDVSPDMNMYRLLQSQDYTVHSALSEFIDNSIQSYLDNRDSIQTIDKKNQKLKVKISIDSKKKEIIILDNAGGINKDNFQKAIKMDVNAKHKKSSLSKFGVGMKTAAVWFSSTWEIETSALYSKEKLISEFNLKKLLMSGETEMSVYIENERGKNHYTKLTIKNSNRIEPREYYEETVIPHLAETFIKFKDFMVIEIQYDNITLSRKRKGKEENAYFIPSEPLNYPLVNSKGETINNNKKIWKKRIKLNYKGDDVRGYFIIMRKGSYIANPGIRLFRNRRVIEGTIIEPNRPEILVGTKNKYAPQRLYGELHLDNFEVNFMKTKFNYNLNPLYLRLRRELQEEKFIDQAEFFKVKEAKKDKQPEQVSDDTPTTPSKSIIVRSKGKSTKKKIPLNNTKIQKSEEIDHKLLNLKRKKLYSLYNSLCIVSLQEHPYLSYVGSWAFLECLARYMGNTDNNSFESFYKNKINSWYKKTSRTEKKSLEDAIKDIYSKGNDAKHSYIREFSDSKQLNKDFKVLENFIIKCINDINEE